MENQAKKSVDYASRCYISGITPFTMIDFPGHTACVVWIWGCNFRCQYCHNPNLVTHRSSEISQEELITLLRERMGKLDGVVFSGGECTMFSQLPHLISCAKEMGYLVKIDTNGSNPKMLSELLQSKQVDYVALDYKAPKSKMRLVAGVGEHAFSCVSQSLEVLMSWGGKFEVRTTVHSSLLNEDDVCEIMEHLSKIGYSGVHYIQNFQQSDTIGNLPNQERPIDCALLNQRKPGNLCLEFRNF